METREWYRRRTKPKSEPSGDKFSTLLIGQSIICGIVFLILLLIKTVNGNFYNDMESKITGSGFGKSNLSDINTKIGEAIKTNSFISKLFGNDGAAYVFSWFKGSSNSSSISSSSSASISSSAESSSASEDASSGSASSSSGSSSQVSGASSKAASSNKSSSSKASSSSSGVSSRVSFGESAGTGDGLIFQYGYVDSSIIKAYGLLGEIENEDEGIIIPDKNSKELPSNVSLKKVTAPEKVYKPVSGGRLSSKFDFREDPFTGEYIFHTGIDIGIAQGTTVKAAMSGTVLSTGTSSVGGKYIKLEHKNGFITYYGHLSSISVKKGANVKANAKIGLSGNTGRSTGPHLHFEIRQNSIRLNPLLYITV